jgi:hypothetical protein
MNVADGIEAERECAAAAEGSISPATACRRARDDQPRAARVRMKSQSVASIAPAS